MTTQNDSSPERALFTAQLQRRIVRLLLRHDRRAFRGRFRAWYAQSLQPQPDILRAYDRFARLVGLADELFDDLLPRIRRQLSFSATRLELNEETPLRGQIDWRETLRRTSAAHPDQPPLRFATTLRSRSFATPENRMVVALLLRYAQLLGALRSDTLFEDEPLTSAEQRDIMQLEDRVRREVAAPHLHELARDIEAAEADTLVAQVRQRLRGGVNPYADLIAWWERIEHQHLQTRGGQPLSPVLQVGEQADLLYQIWFALELVEMLAEQGLLHELQIATDSLRCQFHWRERAFVFVYDRCPGQERVWEGVRGAGTSYSITRADAQNVVCRGQVYWQEPGVLLHARCNLGAHAYGTTAAIEQVIAAMQLVDARNAALVLPDLGDAEPYAGPDPERYLASVASGSAVHVYAMRPFETGTSLHAHLSRLLDQVAVWLPERPPIACYGRVPDCDTVTPSGRAAAETPLIFCPKPHISPTHVDMVSPLNDCLKNPRVCHLMGVGSVAGLIPPFVARVLDQEQLVQAIDQLRANLNAMFRPTDDSEEADQARGALIEAIGQLVDSYSALRKIDITPIEDRLELIFGPYWSDQHDPRGLPSDVRNMLISGDFVYYEFLKGGVLDWAASAVQYVRAVEHELHRRLYDRFGQPSPLRDWNSTPLQPHRFTFGTVSTAFYKRQQGDHNWRVFLNRAVLPGGSSPADFERAVGAVSGLYQLRNQIAHSQVIDQTKAQTVRDITLGNPKASQTSALKQLVSLLDV